MPVIMIIKSRFYICLRYKKAVKFISGLISHINTCKILITLLYHQLPNLK